MKHRWELMCLSVRIDETYYQQVEQEEGEAQRDDREYINTFHRARSLSNNSLKYVSYAATTRHMHPPATFAHPDSPQLSPRKRFMTHSSPMSHKRPVVQMRGREASTSRTVVVNGLNAATPKLARPRS